ncbi:MAG TPA: hypothetical protein VM008_07525 [Phycisphaerae bacterium]|nr:hypothetical protein [Phycisphaerae bacterium]
MASLNCIRQFLIGVFSLDRKSLGTRSNAAGKSQPVVDGGATSGSIREYRNHASGCARRQDLMGELETRQFFSATPLVSSLLAPSTILYAAVPGATNLTANVNGELWYTANGTLENLTIDNRTAKNSTPPGATAEIPPVVSHIVVSGSAEIWFAVAASDGNSVGRLIANKQFEEITAGSATPIRNLTTSGGRLWFSRGANEIDGLDATGKEITITIPGLRTLTGLSAGNHGRVWFAGVNLQDEGVAGTIGSDGSVTMLYLPIIPTSITQEKRGDVFVGGSGAIERISVNGSVTQMGVPVSAPRELTVSGDGSLWFINDPDTRQILQVTRNGNVRRYAVQLPTGALITSLSIAPDGELWFTATTNSAGWVGTFTTEGAPHRIATSTTRPRTESGDRGSIFVFSGKNVATFADGNALAATVAVHRSTDEIGLNPSQRFEHLRPAAWVPSARTAVCSSQQLPTEKSTRVVDDVDDPGSFEGEFALNSPQPLPSRAPKDPVHDSLQQVEPTPNVFDDYSSSSLPTNTTGLDHSHDPSAPEVGASIDVPAAICYLSGSLPVIDNPIQTVPEVLATLIQISACSRTQFTFNLIHLSSAIHRKAGMSVVKSPQQERAGIPDNENGIAEVSKVLVPSGTVGKLTRFTLCVSAAGGIYPWRRRSVQDVS